MTLSQSEPIRQLGPLRTDYVKGPVTTETTDVNSATL